MPSGRRRPGRGLEFVLLASNGSATVCAGVKSGYTSIESPSLGPPTDLREFSTAIEPDVEIDDKNIYADASFMAYEDTDTLHLGRV